MGGHNAELLTVKAGGTYSYHGIQKNKVEMKHYI
jgi:hypothetical protein